MAALDALVPRGAFLTLRAPVPAREATALGAYSDYDLIALVAEGNERALGELYDRFAPMGYGLAVRVLRERELAEDAVQEAFLSLWRFADRFDSRRGTARNWVLTLVHRRSVDLVRRNERRRRQDTQLLSTPLAPSAAETTELDAERRTVQAALALLPEKQRTVLELAYYGGYSQQEIAARLAIPIGTVKSQTYHALHRLQQLLEPTRSGSA